MQPGDNVFHKAFGYGTIISITASSAEVSFESGTQTVTISELTQSINS